MNEDIMMIAEATARILADLADPQAANATDYDAGPLWEALVEAGLTRAWLAEEAGGAGLGLEGGFEICRIAGQYACPVPLVETLLAGWALAEAGLEVPDGALTLAPVRNRSTVVLADGRLSGVARNVPHCGAAAALVVLCDDEILCFDPGSYEVTPRPTDMGEARGDVAFDAAQAQARATCPGLAASVERLGATARACQMTGALETALAITTDYAGEREAFGRKIGKFQAVQQNLAQLAGEVAAALTASGSAAATLAEEALDSDAAFLEVAAAKIRCGEAVEKGAAIAHQSMGAIGWTQEHILQRFTRRMFGWRDDFGAEADWAVRLGTHVSGLGGREIWPMLTTR